MTRRFIRFYCCPWCEGSKQRMKNSRGGRRKLRETHRRYTRLLRRSNRQRLALGDYEPNILSYERWF